MNPLAVGPEPADRAAASGRSGAESTARLLGPLAAGHRQSMAPRGDSGYFPAKLLAAAVDASSKTARAPARKCTRSW